MTATTKNLKYEIDETIIDGTRDGAFQVGDMIMNFLEAVKLRNSLSVWIQKNRPIDEAINNPYGRKNH